MKMNYAHASACPCHACQRLRARRVRLTVAPNHESLAELLRRSTPGVTLRPMEEKK